MIPPMMIEEMQFRGYNAYQRKLRKGDWTVFRKTQPIFVAHGPCNPTFSDRYPEGEEDSPISVLQKAFRPAWRLCAGSMPILRRPPECSIAKRPRTSGLLSPRVAHICLRFVSRVSMIFEAQLKWSSRQPDTETETETVSHS